MKPAIFPTALPMIRLGDKFGYIDSTGKIVVTPQYASAGDFHEGLAAVKLGNEFGYVNKSGQVKINPQFDLAGDFSDGLALVETAGHCGYINKSGSFVINPQFDQGGNFRAGIAPVWIGSQRRIHRQRWPVRLESDQLSKRANGVSYATESSSDASMRAEG